MTSVFGLGGLAFFVTQFVLAPTETPQIYSLYHYHAPVSHEAESCAAFVFHHDPALPLSRVWATLCGLKIPFSAVKGSPQNLNDHNRNFWPRQRCLYYGT